jgi:hypothetical protein
MKREGKQMQQRTIEPRDDEIAVTAYQIWEKEGRPSGRDFENWIQAKSQLTGEKARAAKRETVRAG